MTVETQTSSTIAGSAAIAISAYVGSGVNIEDDVIVGENACILGSSDSLDRSQKESAFVKKGAKIAANATVLPGVVIGTGAMVKPGSVVTRSVPPLAVVEGNPAVITGYVATETSDGTKWPQPISKESRVHVSNVKGVVLHHLRMVPDLRGNLSAGEFERDVPFLPKRFFLVFGVPTQETRGAHAHRECHQFLVCVRGCCAVVADDGRDRQEFSLERPDMGLYLPPMIWGIQYKYSADGILLVFASDWYDHEDYIRDYEEFLKEVRQK